MYETTEQIELKNSILRSVRLKNKEEILSILYNESENLKLPDNCLVQFCNCGYPISYQIDEISENTEKVISKPVLLENILKEETDFDDYTISYFCPNCNALIEEQKY